MLNQLHICRHSMACLACASLGFACHFGSIMQAPTMYVYIVLVRSLRDGRRSCWVITPSESGCYDLDIFGHDILDWRRELLP